MKTTWKWLTGCVAVVAAAFFFYLSGNTAPQTTVPSMVSDLAQVQVAVAPTTVSVNKESDD